MNVTITIGLLLLLALGLWLASRRPRELLISARTAVVRNGSVTIITPPRHAFRDLQEHARLRDQLLGLVREETGQFIIDLSQIHGIYGDGAFGVIVETFLKLKANGSNLVVISPPERIKNDPWTFQPLLGLLTVVDSLPEAMQVLEGDPDTQGVV